MEYQRELWLWLGGERTWAQCSSGLAVGCPSISRVSLVRCRDTTSGCPPSPVARLRAVSVVRDGRALLDSVDWEAFAGERWVVLGPNGSARPPCSRSSGSVVADPWRRAATRRAARHVDLRSLRPRIALVSGSVVRQLRADLSAREWW